MNLPGTEMGIITFFFICLEVLLLFYVGIYLLARPDEKETRMNGILLALLIIYNVTAGLYPDPNMPGSIHLQECIAYGMGFLTPCFFPYYVYRCLGLKNLRFHAFKGVFIFLAGPYILFLAVYLFTDSLIKAQIVLIIPLLYAMWFIASMTAAIIKKYKRATDLMRAREELLFLLFSLTPWASLPLIAFFNINQNMEALATNTGFLLLMFYSVRKHIHYQRLEHERLIYSEQRLKDWNEKLQNEVDKRTQQYLRANEEKINAFINIAHETKTPITLINNYLNEYISKNQVTDELSVVKRSMDKMTRDITNLFDLEKNSKGKLLYDNKGTTDLTEILEDCILLFKEVCSKNNQAFEFFIEKPIFIKASPEAVCRVINNLLDNAVKYTPVGGKISLFAEKTPKQTVKIVFKDNGKGIPISEQKHIFKPYYQINNNNKTSSGMGLGLPLVEKILKEMGGTISLESDPSIKRGTIVTIELNLVQPTEHSRSRKFDTETVLLAKPILKEYSEKMDNERETLGQKRKRILVIEDNSEMGKYLFKKLASFYTVKLLSRAERAWELLKEGSWRPDLIITDLMMPGMGGANFIQLMEQNAAFSHIPMIIVSAKGDVSTRLEGIDMGAIYFIPKPFRMAEMYAKIKTILSLQEKTRHQVVENIIQNIEVPGKSVIDPRKTFLEACQSLGFTSREIEVTQLLKEGFKRNDIAHQLNISPNTVRTHIKNIYLKAEVTNNVSLLKRLNSPV